MEDEKYIDKVLTNIIDKHRIRESKFSRINRTSLGVGNFVIRSLSTISEMKVGSLGRLELEDFNIQKRINIGHSILGSVGVLAGAAVVVPQLVNVAFDFAQFYTEFHGEY